MAQVDLLCTVLSLTRGQLVERALRAELRACDEIPEAKAAFAAVTRFKQAVASRKAVKP